MAKRSRGTTRPGQRRPTGRTAARPGARPAPTTARPTTSLTEAEAARAAELEEQMLAEERAAEATRARDRTRARGRSAEPELGRSRTRDGSLLAARAAEEYTYVVRDVRRIATVGGALIGVMAILFVLIEVVGVVRI